MKHFAAPSFWKAMDELPLKTRAIAEQKFELLKQDPFHPSLHFKKIGNFWSARANIGYRALAIQYGEDFIWFWIGSKSRFGLMISGFDKYEESPRLFMKRAKEFYSIASVSFNFFEGEDRISAREEVIATGPVYYNLCMAVELSLKAAILFKEGISSKFRTHDLSMLFSRCKEIGLDTGRFNDVDLATLKLYSYCHMAIGDYKNNKELDTRLKVLSQSLRYGITGVFPYRCFYLFSDFILKLFEEVERLCNGELNWQQDQPFNKLIEIDKAKLKRRFDYLASPISEIFEFDKYEKMRLIPEMEEVCEKLRSEEDLRNYVAKPNAHTE